MENSILTDKILEAIRVGEAGKTGFSLLDISEVLKAVYSFSATLKDEYAPSLLRKFILLSEKDESDVSWHMKELIDYMIVIYLIGNRLGSTLNDVGIELEKIAQNIVDPQ